MASVMSTAVPSLKRYSVNDMATEKRITGNLGEDFAENYFKKKGFSIVRNYHSRYGEVDIIAENEEYVLFVEVKTRKENTLVSGIQSVDSHKQSRLILAAQDYITKTYCEKQPRFDVAEVTVFEKEDKTLGYNLKYIENAF